MDRRRHTREFKVEAVKLVRERGVAVKQAARRSVGWDIGRHRLSHNSSTTSTRLC
jgi:transposase-like protein